MFLPNYVVNILSQAGRRKSMGWDSEFFMPRNNVLESEKEAAKKINKEKKLRCAGCNELIGAVSTTLYEIEEKHYCSGCYSRKVTYMAIERDHFDIKQAKEARKK